MKLFLRSFSPFTDPRRAVGILAKVFAQNTGSLLRELNLSRKSVNRLTDQLNMALTVLTRL